MAIGLIGWGETPKGENTTLYTLTNDQGNSVAFTDYGAALVSCIVPDKKGKKTDVVLGFDNLKGYLEDTCYIGSTVGRFANRIKNGRFSIDGNIYQIGCNAGGEHSLHGGFEGLNTRVWAMEAKSGTKADEISFTTVSDDGDQGFPGKLKVIVSYKWSNDNILTISFKAKTDKATPVNLTNHAYFNLDGKGNILNQQLKIYADNYLLMEEGCIVGGKTAPVKGSPYDFTSFKAIGSDIDANDPQIKMGKGFDESFLIKTVDDGNMQLIAEAFSSESGIKMKAYSTYPTVHLYTSNFLTSANAGKQGKNYGEREAFCLEAQYAPNSPNLTDFPSCILTPDRVYKHKTEFHFSV